MISVSKLAARALLAGVLWSSSAAADLEGRLALGCLALNIYHEARGESVSGRVAIAAVTMNRVRSEQYPDTICEVVWQYRQFSWTRAPVDHWVVRDKDAWSQARRIARLFLTGAVESEVGDATHYHSLAVHPDWIAGSWLVAHIDGHLFYLL